MTKKSFTTRALNVPFPKKDAHNALHFPVYESVAYEFDSAEQIAANFRGEYPAHVYSRTGNPTVEYFEMKMKALTGGYKVLATSSGMAAISNALLSVCASGDNIISGRNLFGHTAALFTQTFPSYGIETRFIELNKRKSIEEAIDDNTRVIYFETITNPQLEIPDIEMLVDIAQKHNLIVVADSTLTPPNVFNALRWGVSIEVMSTTKFVSGGATSVGGIIVDYGLYDWKQNPSTQKMAEEFGKDAFFNRLKKVVFRNLGACMTAHTAYFQILGLDILELRVAKAVENCTIISTFLKQNEKVSDVNYPGMQGSEFQGFSNKFFDGKPGAIMTFDLASEDECFKFMNALKVIRRATNLNDNKTLIIHPWSTIYVEFTEAQRKQMGIRPTMMRLSVGIEGGNDLVNDMSQALRFI